MRTLVIVLVLSLLASFAIARGVDLWRASQPPDAPVTAHTLAKPRALRVPVQAIEGPRCQEFPLWELFDGEVAGLARVDADGQALLVGAVPGNHPFGPDPLPALTVIDGGGSAIVPVQARSLEQGAEQSLLALRLTPAQPSPDRLAFVTSACPGNRAARLRGWSMLDAPSLPADEQRALLADMATRLTRDIDTPITLLDRRDGSLPGNLATIPVRIPGCRTLVVLNDFHGPTLLRSEHYAGLLCLDGDHKISRAPVPLTRDLLITQVGVLDLDGDGRDEIAVTRRQLDARGLHDTSDTLLWFDDNAELHTEVLLRSP